MIAQSCSAQPLPDWPGGGELAARLSHGRTRQVGRNSMSHRMTGLKRFSRHLKCNYHDEELNMCLHVNCACTIPGLNLLPFVFPQSDIVSATLQNRSYYNHCSCHFVVKRAERGWYCKSNAVLCIKQLKSCFSLSAMRKKKWAVLRI